MSEATRTPTSFQGNNPMDDPYLVALQASYTLAELYSSSSSAEERRIQEKLVKAFALQHPRSFAEAVAEIEKEITAPFRVQDLATFDSSLPAGYTVVCGRTLTAEQMEHIRKTKREEGVFAAITLVRRMTQASLQDAKDFVTNLQV